MGWVVNSTPRPLFSREKAPVPIDVWRGGYGEKKILLPIQAFDPESSSS
jgi:hypothetical protein